MLTQQELLADCCTSAIECTVEIITWTRNRAVALDGGDTLP